MMDENILFSLTEEKKKQVSKIKLQYLNDK